jgi:peptidylprolyl isomerase
MQRVFLIILACLALVVAGCGDDSSTSTTSSGDTTSEAEAPQNEETTTEEDDEAASDKPSPGAEGEGFVPKVKVPNGPPPKQLEIQDLKQGSGAAAKAGDEVGVEYIGVLFKTGGTFDANWESESFVFTLGEGEVIPGWDEGLVGMKVGGERKLIIPPEMAYGKAGAYPSIPPNETLVFQVKLNEVN